MNESLPTHTRAIILSGPGKLTFTTNKPLPALMDNQILARVEAVGLCRDDLDLVHGFAAHPRKAAVSSGLAIPVLSELAGYVPDEQPTVPGHEAAVRVVAAGERVKAIAPGQRYAVAINYPWLKTPHACASFGYNFEGALQDYVIFDQRVIEHAEESTLLPVHETWSSSSIALAEPWACVEASYRTMERRQIRQGGKLMVVVSDAVSARAANVFLNDLKISCSIVWHAPTLTLRPERKITLIDSLAKHPDSFFDDIIFFGTDASLLERTMGKLAPKGIICIVQCGHDFQRHIQCPIGRVLNEGIRIIGTNGSLPFAAYDRIPLQGEIKSGDQILIVGAGTMGTRHAFRLLTLGLSHIGVFVAELLDNQLQRMQRVGQTMAGRNVTFAVFNPRNTVLDGAVDQVVITVPEAALVNQWMGQLAPRGVIHLAAGFGLADTTLLDANLYIHKQAYLLGTCSASTQDMKHVIQKMQNHKLNPDYSVGAVCGLDAVLDGYRALESGIVSGKIIVYPACRGLPLTPLESLAGVWPDVAEQMPDGLWNANAEKTLLAHYPS